MYLDENSECMLFRLAVPRVNGLWRLTDLLSGQLEVWSQNATVD
jgi:hypothetical protein